MPEGASSLYRELELRLPCRYKGSVRYTVLVSIISRLPSRSPLCRPADPIARSSSIDRINLSSPLAPARPIPPSRPLPLPNNDPRRPLSPGSRRPNRGGPLGNVTHRRLSRLLIYKMGFLDTRRPVIVPARPAQRSLADLDFHTGLNPFSRSLSLLCLFPVSFSICLI